MVVDSLGSASILENPRGLLLLVHRFKQTSVYLLGTLSTTNSMVILIGFVGTGVKGLIAYTCGPISDRVKTTQVIDNLVRLGSHQCGHWSMIIIMLQKSYVLSKALEQRYIESSGKVCDQSSSWLWSKLVVPSVAEWSKALESDASAGGESPVRAPVRAATLCPYAYWRACLWQEPHRGQGA